ncbi:hypothetical protein GIB67_011653 [Kingdonia uniflora]|uniref:Uncharacterized protein n=1 Tax=Kingdonia uniflora TaxID=39325 RepID=A0A7J7NAD5_9MAGN|nr:hypothetical protein GIB67_011653 [Kingdonia uniflora]
MPRPREKIKPKTPVGFPRNYTHHVAHDEKGENLATGHQAPAGSPTSYETVKDSTPHEVVLNGLMIETHPYLLPIYGLVYEPQTTPAYSPYRFGESWDIAEEERINYLSDFKFLVALDSEDNMHDANDMDSLDDDEHNSRGDYDVEDDIVGISSKQQYAVTEVLEQLEESFVVPGSGKGRLDSLLKREERKPYLIVALYLVPTLEAKWVVKLAVKKTLLVLHSHPVIRELDMDNKDAVIPIDEQVWRIVASPHRVKILSSSLEVFKKIQYEITTMYSSREEKTLNHAPADNHGSHNFSRKSCGRNIIAINDRELLTKVRKHNEDLGLGQRHLNREKRALHDCKVDKNPKYMEPLKRKIPLPIKEREKESPWMLGKRRGTRRTYLRLLYMFLLEYRIHQALEEKA